MSWRRPPLALVLVAVSAVFAGTLALAMQGPRRLGPPSATGSPPAHSCQTALATVQRAAHAEVKANVVVRWPVAVTERVDVQGRIAVATRSETIVERLDLSQPVAVQRGAVIAHRSCAIGETTQSARGRALTTAYGIALRQARRRAAAAARQNARTLVAEMTAAEIVKARELALTRARHDAVAQRALLARAALADATARSASLR